MRKPAGNPPAWVFGPVWSALYLRMAVAAWLVWRVGGAGRGLALWVAQLVLNAFWSLLFFGLQRPGLALLDIVLLVGAIAATLHAFHRVRPLAGWLLLPCLAWVGFAAYLNVGLWILNR